MRCCSCLSKSCCRRFWCQIYRITLKAIPAFIAQLIGWALFSYVEDNMNVLDCFINRKRVAEMAFPSVNQLQLITELFERLANRTGQALSKNQSGEVYGIFATHFNAPEPVYAGEKMKAALGCIRWYRFSVATMTTIGFGEIAPKTNTGRLLVIPYALITMPLMLSLLAYVGIVISDWVERIMHSVNRLIRGDKTLRYRLLMQSFFLVIVLLLAMISLHTDLALEFQLSGMRPVGMLDGLYFAFYSFTTIGYGDPFGLASGLNFYGYHLIFGLAAVSGLSNTFLAIADRLKFTCTANSLCCCCVYVEDETADVAPPEPNNGSEVQA